MAGNKNSGRKKSMKEATLINFLYDKNKVEVLNKIAKKYANNNRSEVIKSALDRLVETFLESEK